MSKKDNPYQPYFYRNLQLLKLGFMVYRKWNTLFADKNTGIHKKDSSNGIISSLKMRKRLALTKTVKFNNHYYSSPVMPGFPSKVFDNSVRNGGLNFNSAGTPLKSQIDSMFLAITNKCVLDCKHCYEKQNLNRLDEGISVEQWKEIISHFQRKGVSIIILTGGEPLYEFDKTLELLRFGNKNLSDFHIHTSGMTITREKVKELKNSGLTAAAVGLDHYLPEQHDKIRGKGSFNTAVEALKLFNEEGIMTYVNICATKELIRSNGIWKYYELVKNLNVGMIQLLEPRPCGGYFGNGFEELLEAGDKETLLDFTIKGNSKRKYKNYPIIYYVAHIEGKDQLGCHMGGLSLFYIDSAGNVCPCVFFPVSFGNIKREKIEDVYYKMRENIPHPIRSDCPSLKISESIKMKYGNISELPVPFESIKNDFQNLFNNQRGLI
jgi:MoaA/NifB/PqqE/SkfB family radical SAM enzyme